VDPDEEEIVDHFYLKKGLFFNENDSIQGSTQGCTQEFTLFED